MIVENIECQGVSEIQDFNAVFDGRLLRKCLKLNSEIL